jgi:drug/metabolite transporter (DMT)-like permease
MTWGAVSVRLYCKGLAIAPIAVVTTLNFTIPLFTLVMARIFLKVWRCRLTVSKSVLKGPMLSAKI